MPSCSTHFVAETKKWAWDGEQIVSSTTWFMPFQTNTDPCIAGDSLRHRRKHGCSDLQPSFGPNERPSPARSDLRRGRQATLQAPLKQQGRLGRPLKGVWKSGPPEKSSSNIRYINIHIYTSRRMTGLWEQGWHAVLQLLTKRHLVGVWRRRCTGTFGGRVFFRQLAKCA